MKKATVALTLVVSFTSIGFTFSQEDEKEKKKSATEKYNEKKEQITRTRLFGDDDPAFKAIEIPDKWKNESAVILNQKLDYAYMRKMSGPMVEETFRRRIKLLDRASVKEYSEFQFVDYGTYEQGIVGIKIIKGNGKIIEVSTEKAVDLEGEISSIYQTYNYIGSTKYKKLAIPDLEPGDILDYFYYTKQQFLNYDQSFDRFSFTLNQKYPILNQKFNFIIDHGFYINFNTYNGAQVITDKMGTYKNGNSDDKVKYYTVVDKDREKLKEEIWDAPLINYPSVKFQVYYLIQSNVRDYSAFLGKKDEIKKSVAMEEVVAKINTLVESQILLVEEDFSEIRKYIKKKFPTESNQGKLADEIFYAYRHEVFFNEYTIAKEENLYRDVAQLKEYVKNLNTYIEKKDFTNLDDIYNVKDVNFVATMVKLLEYFKVDVQIVAAVPNRLGTLKNVLFLDEISLAIVIKDGNKQNFYYPFNVHSTNDVPKYDLEGSDAIAFKFSKSAKDVTYKSIKIPITSPRFNNYKTKTEVKLGNNQDLFLTREHSIAGNYKKNYGFIMYSNDDYIMEDINKYEKDFERKELKNYGLKEKEIKKLKKQYYDKRIEFIKEKLKFNLSNDFEIIKYDTFDVVNRARFEPNSKLMFIEKFSAKNIVNKIGNNYSINVGVLIGKQTKISEENINRSSNITYNFARSIEDEIIINIPDGYKAEGLKDLNFNIDNATATFTSIAEQNGNTISIKVTKEYKHNSEKKEQWNQLREILDTAYNFSQKKIILKKV